MFEFDDEVLDGVEEEEFHGPPALVCWYSGGFVRQDGVELLTPLLEAAKAAGVRDHLILDHPNGYGMTGEAYAGYGAYPSYVGKLVEDIDKVYPRRLLFLFGHSRGCCQAAAVATRLGRRVLAVYFVACQGSIVPRRKTPWERLDRRFQMNGERSMLAFFAEMQPGNILLRRASKADDEELEEMKATSSFLSNMVDLMSSQYVRVMHPNMAEGDIAQFPADICAISPKDDPHCRPESLEEFTKLTYGDFTLLSVRGSHMGCLTKAAEGTETSDLHTQVLRHMLARWQSPSLVAWQKRLHGLQQDLIFGRLIVREGPGVGDAARALQRHQEWVQANPWATEDEVQAKVANLQRYLLTQI